MNYRHKANLTLSVVCIAFILSAVLRRNYPAVWFYRLAFFVLEAALVGGLADWFAVTALFRKPLGFPYHTELIPRNRCKVVQGVTSMVEGELLSKQAVRAKIEGVRFDRLAINLLESKSCYLEAFGRKAGQAAVDYLNNLDRAWAAGELESLIRDKLQSLDTGESVQRAVAWVFARGFDEQWLDCGLNHLRALAEEPATREKLYRFLQSQKQEQTRDNLFKGLIAGLLESTDSLNLAEAARVLQDTLVENLVEFQRPWHPVRLKLKQILLENLGRMDKEPAWLAAVEGWKREVLEQIALGDVTLALVNSLLEAASTPAAARGKAPAAAWVENQLNAYWERFKHDPGMRDWFDKWCKEIIVRLVDAEHYLVGEIVFQTLSAFSVQDLNRFIEDKAGNDLQWIRINGSLVGGVIGLLLFVFLSYIYDPLLVPLLQGWFGWPAG